MKITWLIVLVGLLSCSSQKKTSKSSNPEGGSSGNTPSQSESTAANTSNSTDQNNSPSQNNNPNVVYHGYTIEGISSSCPAPADDLICTAQFTPNDQYANDCRDQGFEVYRCGCHNHLCSQNLAAKNPAQTPTTNQGDLKSGYDYMGQPRQCIGASQSIICTQIYTVQDAYGSECVKAGKTAIFCGCHDYICSEKISFSASSHSPAQSK